MSRLSSWLAKRGGKVGQALNKVGSVLPSAGQLVGGLAMGPVGTVVGGRVDPYTSDTQQKIGDTVAAAAIPAAIPHVLPKGTPVPAIPGSDPTKPPGSNGGGTDYTSLILGGLSGVNAAQLASKSSDYATKAYDQSQENWQSRQPLRMAGVQGMLNAGPSAFGSQVINNLGDVSGRNPFAKPAIRMAPPPVSSVPTSVPQTERDQFALGDPKQPALKSGERTGQLPLLAPGGWTPGRRG